MQLAIGRCADRSGASARQRGEGGMKVICTIPLPPLKKGRAYIAASRHQGITEPVYRLEGLEGREFHASRFEAVERCALPMRDWIGKARV